MSNQVRKCERCGQWRSPSFYMKETSTICKICRDEKFLRKKEKFQDIDLGIEGLDSTFDSIIVMSNDTKTAHERPFKYARKLVEDGLAKVIYPNMVYDLIDHQIVLTEAGYRCHYCGNYGDTIDHVIPTSKGGEDTYENKVCSCKECNTLKLDRDYNEFKSIFDEHGKHLGKKIARERFGKKPKKKGPSQTPKEPIKSLTEEEKFDAMIKGALRKDKW
ncbi:HNH endonuclease [Paenibacillus sp. QZ-Y1]|uniref:HNH endonuclease n=1 Tax=Paenibacillus sp. QZ-Y1 TaxID=3414511 RepID=UPI003F78DA38